MTVSSDSSPKVSVIIPTYNRRDLLGVAIDSVLGQTFQDFELIVVDDGSTDGTADLLEGYGERVRAVTIPHTGRLAHVRNRGLGVATGKYVAFLDSDDFWLPAYLERHFALLEASDSVGLTYSNYRFLFPDGSKTGPLLTPDLLDAGRLLDNLLGGVPLNPSVYVFRRWLISQIGGIDESRATQGTFEFLLRLARVASARSLPEPLALIRRGPASFSSQHDLLHFENAIGVLDDFLSRERLTIRQLWLGRRNVARLTAHVGLRRLEVGQRRAALSFFLRSLRWNPLQRGAWFYIGRTLLSGPVNGRLGGRSHS